MNGLEITKQLKCSIESNQTRLKSAIQNHQKCLLKLKTDPYNVDLQKEVNIAEDDIIFIGLEQKSLLERLRDEYKAFQKLQKNQLVKNGIEERRFNLTNALNRARKQNILARSASTGSFSDDSQGGADQNCSPNSSSSSPEHRPTHRADSASRRSEAQVPRDLAQSEFLSYFCLATHDLYREMQNRRAERKRRSTANPHFLYGNKGWDFLTGNKRKRNNYLVSPVSPPNTRQSVRKKQERTSPPLNATTTGSQASPAPVLSGGTALSSNGGTVTAKQEANAGTASASTTALNKNVLSSFPSIPNLPSGLIIERVSPSESPSPDTKVCNVCKLSGAITICETCSNGFHISCHNRPLSQTPRQCPKCMIKEVRTIGTLNVPSGMTVSYINTPEYTEKLNEKKQLEEKRQTLTAELTQLQNRHSQLTISLKDQKNQQDELLMTQQSTEEKIKQILNFINQMKEPPIVVEEENSRDEVEPASESGSSSS
ncbi:unnamed protein product [Callosobruchus maculatus]|uniref:Zinc finger PHD-type domain-containing protein n=1 Tax=Callosobruchus maculatus TaxID=64391 RepID=A0A653BH50_CALMS|nr:unnamed protein product [Callosobruchus maculatus]